MQAKYNRVLLKLSGEYLAGSNSFGIDFDTTAEICKSIKKCVNLGVQIAIVVGGGNFWRGRSSGQMNRARADSMGMLATVINALGLCEALEQEGVPAVVETSVDMNRVAEVFTWEKAVAHLNNGKVVIFAGGTGSPFFSTDTAAALRAAEIGADIMFKATMVDGVYDSDPKENPDAVRYDNLTYSEVLQKNLKVMDSAAASLCMDNNINIEVFSLESPDNIVKAVCGEEIGTLVTN